MPVIVPRELADTWLTEGSQIAEVIRQAKTDDEHEPVSPPREPTLFDLM
jgi:hypothetical protein